MSSKFVAALGPHHRLGFTTSSFIYSRCLIVNLFHKLLVRRVRSQGQVALDYSKGEWLGQLREARWERCDNLDDYVFTTDTQPIYAIVEGHLSRIARRDYYMYRTHKLVSTLQHFAADSAELVEIGSGSGRNLIALAHASPWKKLVGLELSETGLEVTRKACERFGINTIQTAHINLLNPRSPGFERLRGSVVFSFYCLEQLPDHTRRVLDNLYLAGVKRVIHIEPTTELFNISSLKDLATISYILRQDYQRTLVTTVRDMQSEGLVQILACERLNFAPSCRNDPTLVVWEPVRPSGRP